MANAKWPAVWLVTDERMGNALWDALDRLPVGAGILFRHYDAPDRAELAARLAELASRKRQLLAVAGDVDLARSVGAALVHNPSTDVATLAFSRSVHSIDEADAANRAGASLAFVSPLFRTRSHPDAPPLSRDSARAIVDRLNAPAIALGGVNGRNFEELAGIGFAGWAGIDAWL